MFSIYSVSPLAHNQTTSFSTPLLTFLILPTYAYPNEALSIFNWIIWPPAWTHLSHLRSAHLTSVILHRFCILSFYLWPPYIAPLFFCRHSAVTFCRQIKTECNSFWSPHIFIRRTTMAYVVLFLAMKPYCCSLIATFLTPLPSLFP